MFEKKSFKSVLNNPSMAIWLQKILFQKKEGIFHPVKLKSFSFHKFSSKEEFPPSSDL